MRNIQTKKLLKQMAQDAKERLMNGNYSQSQNLEQKRRIIRQNDLRIIAQNENKRFNVTIKLIDDAEDENFIKKVEDVLEKESITPFKDLVDYDEFQKLSDVERQRYIFDLAKRYNKIKYQYEKRKCANI